MDREHICQTSKKNIHPRLNIRLHEMPRDERLTYIESVCAALIESRFGPDGISTRVICLSDRPDLEPAVFYDPCEGDPRGLAPSFAPSSLGRAGYRAIEADRQRAKQMGIVHADPHAQNSATDLTPNQGRGSP